MHIDRIIGASGVGVAVPFPITTAAQAHLQHLATRQANLY